MTALRLILILLIILVSSCVQETHLKTITFKVDMGRMENVAEVGVRGQFTEPPWEKTIPMTDKDGDGIFETTVTDKTAQNSMQFKFVNQGNQFELFDKNDRSIQFEYGPETLVYEAHFDDENGNQKSIKKPLGNKTDEKDNTIALTCWYNKLGPN